MKKRSVMASSSYAIYHIDLSLVANKCCKSIV